jgi:hypothetical protein
MWSQRLRSLAVAGVLPGLLGLAACGSPAEPIGREASQAGMPSASPDAPTAIPLSSQQLVDTNVVIPTVWKTDPADCRNSNYRYPLKISTTVPVEVKYLQDVFACTDSQARYTYLRNKGDAVWKPATSPGGVKVDYLNDTLRAKSFRQVMVNNYPYALLTPGQELVVYQSPNAVAWDLDLTLSIPWHLHDALINEITHAGEDALTRALKRRSAARAALATCTLNSYNIMKGFTRPDEKSLSEWLMAGVSTTAGGASCVEGWRTAAAAEVKTGQTPTLNPDLLPNIRSSQVEVLQKVDQNLTRAATVGKVVEATLALFRK